MKVLAVIPAFNEESCIEKTVRGLQESCPDLDFVIVNDGSRDSTPSILDERRFPHIDLPVNSGLAAAFGAGMRYALAEGYDAAVQFDADGQHLPNYIALMEKALIDNEADIVIASRYLDGSIKPSGARGIGSRLISFLIFLTTGERITDPTSGMRMYSRRMIEYYTHEFDCAPEPDLIAHIAHKFHSVVEIQADMQDRQGGESYLKLANIVNYMSRTCLSILLFRVLR